MSTTPHTTRALPEVGAVRGRGARTHARTCQCLDPACARNVRGVVQPLNPRPPRTQRVRRKQCQRGYQVHAPIVPHAQQPLGRRVDRKGLQPAARVRVRPAVRFSHPRALHRDGPKRSPGHVPKDRCHARNSVPQEYPVDGGAQCGHKDAAVHPAIPPHAVAHSPEAHWPPSIVPLPGRGGRAAVRQMVVTGEGVPPIRASAARPTGEGGSRWSLPQSSKNATSWTFSER